MHADQAALLLNIADHPDDDTPRLVYADWLEENGESDRAEFIRVQIRKSQLPGTDPAFLPLMQREMALSMQQERWWRSALPQLPGVVWGPFQRGFVTRLTIQDAAGAEALAQHLPALIAQTPLMELVISSSRGAYSLSAFATLPVIPCLRRVRVESTYRTMQLAPLFIARLLSTVRRLDFNPMTLDGDSQIAFFDSPYLYHLEEIHAEWRDYFVTQFERFARVRFPRLHTLAITNHDTPESGIYLRRSTVLPQLRRLDLSNSNLNRDSVSALMQVTMPKLEVLRLNNNGLGNESMTDLVNAVDLTRLHRLELQQHRFTRVGIQRLVNADWAKQLIYLDLSSSTMNDETIAPLLDSPNLKHLEVLKLGRSDLSDDSARRLAENAHFPALRQVDLGRTRLTEVGKRLLQESPHLQQVQWQFYGTPLPSSP